MYVQRSEMKILKFCMGMERRIEEYILSAYLANYELGRQIDEEYVLKISMLSPPPVYGYLELKTLEACSAGLSLSSSGSSMAGTPATTESSSMSDHAVREQSESSPKELDPEVEIKCRQIQPWAEVDEEQKLDVDL